MTPETRVVVFQVNGVPAPQGSKRHVGGGRIVEMSRALGPWREAVRAEAQRAASGVPFEGAVRVSVKFLLGRPRGHTGARGLRPSAPRFPVARPDLDKLLRSTLDGLTMGGLIGDDSQVVTVLAVKEYADGVPVGAEIEVRGDGE